MRDGVWGVTSDTIDCRCQMGAEYDGGISQGINYWLWLQIKRAKQSRTETQEQKKDWTVTIRATNLITYGDDLFTTSISRKHFRLDPFED